MSLTYDGKLGIGITNPTTKLYVVGTSYITGITTIDSNLTVSNNLSVGGNITFNGSLTGNLGITTLSRLGISTSTISSNSYEFFVGGDPVFGPGVAITASGVRASGIIQASNLTSTNANITNINSTGIITCSDFRGSLTGTATTATNVDGGTGSLTRLSVTGVTTSQNGFTSGIGVTNPVKIAVSGNILTFTVVGVGSTSLTLY
jgi:hypothetical protein